MAAHTLPTWHTTVASEAGELTIRHCMLRSVSMETAANWPGGLTLPAGATMRPRPVTHFARPLLRQTLLGAGRIDPRCTFAASEPFPWAGQDRGRDPATKLGMIAIAISDANGQQGHSMPLLPRKFEDAAVGSETWRQARGFD